MAEFVISSCGSQGFITAIVKSSSTAISLSPVVKVWTLGYIDRQTIRDV